MKLFLCFRIRQMFRRPFALLILNHTADCDVCICIRHMDVSLLEIFVQWLRICAFVIHSFGCDSLCIQPYMVTFESGLPLLSWTRPWYPYPS